MSILQDVMYPPNYGKIKDEMRASYKREYVIDKFVKYCTDCKRCYQSSADKSNLVESISYLIDFPTIGKVRAICPECTDIRVICDLCDKDVPRKVVEVDPYKKESRMIDNIVKRDGIWVCNPCDVKYPL